jgi:hypothetical protein
VCNADVTIGGIVKLDNMHVYYLTLVSKNYKQPLIGIWGWSKAADFDFIAGCDACQKSDIDKCIDKTLPKNACIRTPKNNSPERLLSCQNNGRADITFKKCDITNIEHSDYALTGFSRGHIIANSDMDEFACSYRAVQNGGVNVNIDTTCGQTTFSCCNISPQNQELNGGAINDIENAIRDCIIKKKYFINFTGPLFKKGYLCTLKDESCRPDNNRCINDKTRFADKSKYSDCGPYNDGIPVPYAFYKIVININNKKAYCIIINQQIPDNNVENGSVLTKGIDAYKIIDKFLMENKIYLDFPKKEIFVQEDFDYLDEKGEIKCPIP